MIINIDLRSLLIRGEPADWALASNVFNDYSVPILLKISKFSQMENYLRRNDFQFSIHGERAVVNDLFRQTTGELTY